MVGTGSRVGCRGTTAGSVSEVVTAASIVGRPCSNTSFSCCLERSLCLLRNDKHNQRYTLTFINLCAYNIWVLLHTILLVSLG
jgi:hypothetical protein